MFAPYEMKLAEPSDEMDSIFAKNKIKLDKIQPKID